MKIILTMLSIILFSVNSYAYTEISAEKQNSKYKLFIEQPQGCSAADSGTVVSVLSFDLNMSGLFEVTTSQTDAVLLIKTTCEASMIDFKLFDNASSKLLTTKRDAFSSGKSRYLTHQFSDEVLLALTGEKGVFTTKILFVISSGRGKETAGC